MEDINLGHAASDAQVNNRTFMVVLCERCRTLFWIWIFPQKELSRANSSFISFSFCASKQHKQCLLHNLHNNVEEEMLVCVEEDMLVGVEVKYTEVEHRETPQSAHSSLLLYGGPNFIS
jgi:hypothetical protein